MNGFPGGFSFTSGPGGFGGGRGGFSPTDPNKIFEYVVDIFLNVYATTLLTHSPTGKCSTWAVLEAWVASVGSAVAAGVDEWVACSPMTMMT